MPHFSDLGLPGSSKYCPELHLPTAPISQAEGRVEVLLLRNAVCLHSLQLWGMGRGYVETKAFLSLVSKGTGWSFIPQPNLTPKDQSVQFSCSIPLQHFVCAQLVIKL